MIRHKDQLRLNVRFYRVEIPGLDPIDEQAPTRAAAKWQVYKRAKAAGFFRDGFRSFLSRRISVRELRR
nr:hypothetical protein [uncultured Bradyrhizobium sp.]